LTKWHDPAAALDVVGYPFPTKVLWPRESAVAAAQVKPQVPGFSVTAASIPVVEV